MTTAPAFDALDRPPHLLLVDDDDRIRELLKKYLTQAGARVSAAADAAGARKLLDGMDFDLLILDVMMPVEDGFSLAESVRKTSKVPIVLLTARGLAEDRIRGLSIGADDYVLLFAGSGWDRKGLRFAIDAVNASTSQPILLVAGRGRPETMPHSDRVRFLGPVSEMGRVLAAADAFLLPTLYEPFSNACLEALAAGLPVLTTEHNGFAEIIQRGVEGEVFSDPRDTASIAACIDRWADAARRAAVLPQLQEKAARFSIGENVRSTLAIVENLRQTAALE